MCVHAMRVLCACAVCVCCVRVMCSKRLRFCHRALHLRAQLKHEAAGRRHGPVLQRGNRGRAGHTGTSSNTEGEMQEGERISPDLVKAVLASNDQVLIDIVRRLPPESHGRLGKIYKQVNNDDK